MDEARRFIAHETDRNEDTIGKADTALVGLAAQLLERDETDGVVVLTTDKPVGRTVATLLSEHEFTGRVEYPPVQTDCSGGEHSGVRL